MAEDPVRKELIKPPGIARVDAPLQLEVRKSSLPSRDLQQLWFATLRWDWSSLVLVPADSNGSVDRLAKALAQVGDLSGGRALRITAEGTIIASTTELIDEITRDLIVQSTNGGSSRWKKRTIVALDSVLTNPSGIAVVLAADAALLCVEKGKTRIAEARRTVELIGRDHFKGCVLLK